MSYSASLAATEMHSIRSWCKLWPMRILTFTKRHELTKRKIKKLHVPRVVDTYMSASTREQGTGGKRRASQICPNDLFFFSSLPPSLLLVSVHLAWDDSAMTITCNLNMEIICIQKVVSTTLMVLIIPNHSQSHHFVRDRFCWLQSRLLRKPQINFKSK